MNILQARTQAAIVQPPQDRRDWTVAQFIGAAAPDLRLRARVVADPLFSAVTLGELLEEPTRLAAFLNECRGIPQCGDVQINRLQAALGAELVTLGGQGAVQADIALAGQIRANPAESVISIEDHAAAALPVSGLAYACPLDWSAEGEVYLRFWRMALFKPFIYAAVSVPEFAKTPAVMRAEVGEARGLSDYLAKLDTLGRALRASSQVNGLIVLDAHMLHTVFYRQGRYAVLDDADLAAQRALLRRFVAELPAGIECIVVDYERAKLSPIAVVGRHVVLHAAGTVMVFDNPPTLHDICSRSHALRRHAITLERFMDAIA